jgi:hypothetical protein
VSTNASSIQGMVMGINNHLSLDGQAESLARNSKWMTIDMSARRRCRFKLRRHNIKTSSPPAVQISFSCCSNLPGYSNNRLPSSIHICQIELGRRIYTICRKNSSRGWMYRYVWEPVLRCVLNTRFSSYETSLKV